ncbi:MAG: hypothetical protein MMC33_003380 [Icmadophila ericetorum]|nr:hypothetical protein [Icmadophila ericetorum]
MSKILSLVVGSVGLGLVGATSIPTLCIIARKISPFKGLRYEEIRDHYEDGDGKATEESQAAYSTVVPRTICLAASTIGLLQSIAIAILITTQSELYLFKESWFTFGSWALLVLQCLNLCFIHNPLERYRLGVYGAAASAVILVTTCLETGFLGSKLYTLDNWTTIITLNAIQIGVTVIALVSFLSIPRRPAVFLNGRPVDGCFTVSAIARYTFEWGTPVLAYARNHRGLGLDELPMIPGYIRSRNLHESYNNGTIRKRLWRTVAWNFRWGFLKQFLLISTISVSQFAPQFAMLQLLRLLEARTEGASIAGIAWAWIFGLGFSMIVSSWFEAWLFYIIVADIGTPLRSLLAALVFSKATRRKDVKGVGKAKDAKKSTETEAILIGELPINEASGTQDQDAAKAEKKEEGDEDEDLQKSRQSTINLVGVDAKRISDFTMYIYIFPGVAMKLGVSMWFLVSLIGWKSLCAGLLTFIISTPFNIWVSKRYNGAQGDLMKIRDQKMAVVTEALQGIRQIKFSALERQWQARIGEKRRQELAMQWKVFKYDATLISIWILGPVALSAVSLTVYAILNGNLLPSVAFTTIAILGQIESTLSIIPELTTDAIDAWVSVNRINEYLDAPEKSDCITPYSEISLSNASIAWPADSQEEDPDRFTLRDINVKFPHHELSVISGKTGSGKSLMLAAILGEVDLIAGEIKIPTAPPVSVRCDHNATRGNWIIDSSIAYVAQVPWIENATIKDNILFGLPLDTGRYKKVISVCALEKDLEMLPEGELTDIGANGINLSGGQRWRISFARALYSRAGILVLDDIFSAVDAHVGRQLFENALTGELGVGRTRILVTHHVSLCLPKTNYSVLLGEGTVAHAGSVEDLKRTGSLSEFLKEQKEFEEEQEKQAEESLLQVFQDDEINGNTLQKVFSRRSERSVRIDDGELDTKGKSQPKKYMEDEKREIGSIKLGMYKEYIKSSGGAKLWVPLCCFFFGYQALVLTRSYWVTLWTRSYNTESDNIFVHQSTYNYLPKQYSAKLSLHVEADTSLWYYLGIYIGLSIAIVVIGTFRYIITFYTSIRASKLLFEKLSYRVLRTPLRWLDTVPVGRILNRFTADFNTLDSRIAYDLGFFFFQLIEIFGIMLAGFIVSPFTVIFAFALMCAALYIATRYLYGAREVKRLESNAKSPVFEQFGSLLAGVGTVRAFDKTEEYIERMFDKIDGHTIALWHMWLFNRWMGFRLNIVGAMFAITVAALIVSTKGIDASLAGFALAFALQYTGSIIWTLRCYANLEMDMNSVERIIEYSNLEIEDQGGQMPPASWPTEGKLELDNIVAGYAPNLPPVLKGLSFCVDKHQRVGVVGRTGAGKSSLTLTLFRFLEPTEGTMHIDGIDICKLDLHELRSRLAIIPQDPVLFSGTVRSNLDPFDDHTDAALRDALERVHLIGSTGLVSRDEPAETNGSGAATPALGDTNKNIFKSLDSKISEGGLNLSQGQRQLLCLARAIVSRPKIMILDEATSSVDMATDVLIQRSIREEFAESTLLVIAHRLSTIADFDKILVMSDGKAVEFDSPKALFDAKGAFFDMVEQSGEKEKLKEIILGEGGNGEGSSGGPSSRRRSEDGEDDEDG